MLGQTGDRQAAFDWLRGDPSPARPRGSKLPVDGYWPDLGLVVEFHEEQHSRPSPLFDRRRTVSGVGRGEQRRIYDERKRTLIPQHGLRLVMIEKAAFVVRSRQIVRDRSEDIVNEEPPALPEYVERLFAEQRRYCGVLRGSGAIDAAEEVECIRREADGV